MPGGSGSTPVTSDTESRPASSVSTARESGQSSPIAPVPAPAARPSARSRRRERSSSRHRSDTARADTSTDGACPRRRSSRRRTSASRTVSVESIRTRVAATRARSTAIDGTPGRLPSRGNGDPPSPVAASSVSGAGNRAWMAGTSARSASRANAVTTTSRRRSGFTRTDSVHASAASRVSAPSVQRTRPVARWPTPGQDASSTTNVPGSALWRRGRADRRIEERTEGRVRERSTHNTRATPTASVSPIPLSPRLHRTCAS